MSSMDKKWVASDYMDVGQWAVLTEDNEIVVGWASRVTREVAERIAQDHNQGMEAKQKNR